MSDLLNMSVTLQAEVAFVLPLTMQEMIDMMDYCKEHGVAPASWLRHLVVEEIHR